MVTVFHSFIHSFIHSFSLQEEPVPACVRIRPADYSFIHSFIHSLCRKNLYQRVYEYDLPIISPEPKVFEFLQPCDCDVENPWKDSFKMLVRTTAILLC